MNKLNEIAKQIKGMLLQAWGSVVTDWDDMQKRVEAL